MKLVRVVAKAKGRSIPGSASRGSPTDTPSPTNMAVSTRAWKPEPQQSESWDCIHPQLPQHRVNPGVASFHRPHARTHRNRVAAYFHRQHTLHADVPWNRVAA